MPLDDRSSVFLDESGISVGAHHVDPFAVTATRQVIELLGPEVQTTIAGVTGSRRTAHWLQSGVVVVSEDALNDAVVMLFVCFDADDGSPYAERVAQVAAFRGTVHCGDHVFVGGEREEDIQRIPRLRGYGGMRIVNFGQLLVAFYLKKPLDLGKRSGGRKLVRLSAEWGRVRGFATKPDVSEPWAD